MPIPIRSVATAFARQHPELAHDDLVGVVEEAAEPGSGTPESD